MGHDTDRTDRTDHTDHTDGTENVAEDERFGAVTVRLDTGRGEVVVEGGAVPRVELGREGPEDDGHVPVGTRDGDRLALTVDGEEAVVDPSKGRLTRRSFAVDVRYAGGAWRLVPDSVAGSRLLRGREHVGDFVSQGDGRVLAEWREGAEPKALDAALGYALAAAFGTGAHPMWLLAADAIGDIVPG
ncbi:hypothetical protein [Streptomyces sp. NPDC018321]|uniref:hypothetical protein n=1 Tax=unclassified Streptomyces TaxID=2593676 RepID=UPI0037BCF098